MRAGPTPGDYRDTDPAVAAGLLEAVLQDGYLKPRKHAGRGFTVAGYRRTLLVAIEAYLTADRVIDLAADPATADPQETA